MHVTDASNASRTNMLDLRTRQWHAPYVELFGLDLGLMPRVASNAEILGRVKEGPLAGVPISGAILGGLRANGLLRAAYACGTVFLILLRCRRRRRLCRGAQPPPLPRRARAGCLGDQQAALVGQRCGRGEAKNTYGTGCFMLLNTGGLGSLVAFCWSAPQTSAHDPPHPAHAPRPLAPSPPPPSPTTIGSEIVPSTHGLLTTFGYQLGPKAAPHYALEGSIAVAGLGISWLKDNLRLIGGRRGSPPTGRLSASVCCVLQSEPPGSFGCARPAPWCCGVARKTPC